MGLVRRHPILSGFAVILGLALCVLAASAVVVWRAAHVDGASRVQHVDAIIVMGAAEYNGTPSPVFQGRLDHAVLLWQEGRADRVLVLGGKAPGDITTEADAGRTYLISQGVPAGAVIAEPRGRSSFESLRAAASYLHANQLTSAFLVSDPWHNARIERMAGDLGIRGYGSATWTSAAVSHFTRLEGYARETLAYIYYRVFHR